MIKFYDCQNYSISNPISRFSFGINKLLNYLGVDHTKSIVLNNGGDGYYRKYVYSTAIKIYDVSGVEYYEDRKIKNVAISFDRTKTYFVFSFKHEDNSITGYKLPVLELNSLNRFFDHSKAKDKDEFEKMDLLRYVASQLKPSDHHNNAGERNEPK